MYTRHINNLVLYSKGFYRESNNFMDDIKEMVSLDHNISRPLTNKEVTDIVRADYKNWLNSIDYYFDHYESLKKENPDERKVNWCDDPDESFIHAVLIVYSIYIPLHSGFLKAPVYTDKRQPPVTLTVAEANSILKMSQEDIITTLFSDIRTCSFEKTLELAAVLGKNLTMDDINREIDDAYQKFSKMREERKWTDLRGNHFYPDSTFSFRTANFQFRIYLHSRYTNDCTIYMNIILDEHEIVVPHKEITNNPNEVVDMLLEKFDELVDYKQYAAVYNVFRNNREIDFDECSVREEMRDLFREFVCVKTTHYSTELEETDAMCGGLEMKIKKERINYIDHNYVFRIKLIPNTVLTCTENRLFNH